MNNRFWLGAAVLIFAGASVAKGGMLAGSFMLVQSALTISVMFCIGMVILAIIMPLFFGLVFGVAVLVAVGVPELQLLCGWKERLTSRGR